MKKGDLTKKDKILIFLNEYYFGYGILFSLLRVLAGPFILYIGINQYINGNYKALLMIAFGIYYLFQPLILILKQKSWFENFELDYEINPEKMIIKSNKSKSELDYSEFITVRERKKYFVLRTKSKQGIYLPTKLLESNEIDILNTLKKTTANNG